jgi:hypothetical protein
MRPWLPLLLCPVLLAGCSLSKDESTLARLHDKEVNKKKERKKGDFTEEQVGVKFYPGADQFQSKEYDEAGMHIVEVGLSTTDSADKVHAFYEGEIRAKAMPMSPGFASIQANRGGKHYEVSTGQFGDEITITIKVSWPNP